MAKNADTFSFFLRFKPNGVSPELDEDVSQDLLHISLVERAIVVRGVEECESSVSPHVYIRNFDVRLYRADVVFIREQFAYLSISFFVVNRAHFVVFGIF